MESQTETQTDNKGKLHIITKINYKNLGCNCKQEFIGVNYNCGNLVDGFAYFCPECYKKRELRR